MLMIQSIQELTIMKLKSLSTLYVQNLNAGIWVGLNFNFLGKELIHKYEGCLDMYQLSERPDGHDECTGG